MWDTILFTVIFIGAIAVGLWFEGNNLANIFYIRKKRKEDKDKDKDKDKGKDKESE